jgi:hypothetical protein
MLLMADIEHRKHYSALVYFTNSTQLILLFARTGFVNRCVITCILRDFSEPFKIFKIKEQLDVLI